MFSFFIALICVLSVYASGDNSLIESAKPYAEWMSGWYYNWAVYGWILPLVGTITVLYKNPNSISASHSVFNTICFIPFNLLYSVSMSLIASGNDNKVVTGLVTMIVLIVYSFASTFSLSLFSIAKALTSKEEV